MCRVFTRVHTRIRSHKLRFLVEDPETLKNVKFFVPNNLLQPLGQGKPCRGTAVNSSACEFGQPLLLNWPSGRVCHLCPSQGAKHPGVTVPIREESLQDLASPSLRSSSGPAGGIDHRPRSQGLLGCRFPPPCATQSKTPPGRQLLQLLR